MSAWRDIVICAFIVAMALFMAWADRVPIPDRYVGPTTTEPRKLITVVSKP